MPVDEILNEDNVRTAIYLLCYVALLCLIAMVSAAKNVKSTIYQEELLVKMKTTSATGDSMLSQMNSLRSPSFTRSRDTRNSTDRHDTIRSITIPNANTHGHAHFVDIHSDSIRGGDPNGTSTVGGSSPAEQVQVGWAYANSDLLSETDGRYVYNDTNDRNDVDGSDGSAIAGSHNQHNHSVNIKFENNVNDNDSVGDSLKIAPDDMTGIKLVAESMIQVGDNNDNTNNDTDEIMNDIRNALSTTSISAISAMSAMSAMSPISQVSSGPSNFLSLPSSDTRRNMSVRNQSDTMRDIPSGTQTPTEGMSLGNDNSNNNSSRHKSAHSYQVSKLTIQLNKKREEPLRCADFVNALKKPQFYGRWCKDIFIQRGIYGTVLVYAFDIVTDINVMIFWFKEAYHKGRDEIIPFALLSFSIIIVYRTISAYNVFNAISKHLSCLQRFGIAFLQFLDVYIFFQVFRSAQINSKSDKLRWISSMEAALESAPQIILQMVYLLQYESVENISANSLVTLGLFFSVSKLGTTAIAADNLCVHDSARSFFSYKYYVRFFFRIFEMTSRVFFYALIWVVIGGEILGLICIIHFFHNIFLFCGGCLGREIFNIFGFILFIPRLNKTLQEGEIICQCLENNIYIKLYRESEFQITTMIMIRTVELFVYAIGLSLYNIFIINNGEVVVLDVNEPVQILLYRLMFAAGIIMAVLTPLLWTWMLKVDIIDLEKRKEEVAFRDIFEAIKLSRIDAIKEYFNTKQDVTSAKHYSHLNITPLHYACQKDRPAIVYWMIMESGYIDAANVNAVDKFGQTPFYYACKYGSLKAIKVLFREHIRNILDIKTLNHNNQSCIYIACKYGNDEVLNYLLNKCDLKTEFSQMVNQTTKIEYFTALHIASQNGHTECVNLLLKLQNIDVNLVNGTNNEAPIHLALLKKYKNISKTLIDDERLKLSSIGYEKAWHCAIKTDDALVVTKLLERNDLNLNVLRPCITNYDTEYGDNDNDDTKGDDTPILIACNHNSGEVMKIILKIDKSTINLCNSDGHSPLYIACKRGNTDVAIPLLACEDIDVYFKTQRTENSILMASCQGGSEKIFKLLTDVIQRKNGSEKLREELTIVNKHGQTALWIACRFNSYNIVELLTQNFTDYIDLDKKCNQGKTPMVIAEENGNHEVIQALKLYNNFTNQFMLEEDDDDVF